MFRIGEGHWSGENERTKSAKEYEEEERSEAAPRRANC
jgi:hypothetical protein